MENDFQKYLKYTKKIEEDYLGTEMEDESEQGEYDEIPYNVQDIRVDQKMITIYQIEHWIKSDILNLHPEYQRNLVWDDNRKSALIESLMLKIPIPAFYLDENANGMKTVIDGMQRLSAIHDFLNDKFTLRNMQYLTVCEKKVFSQLDIKFRSRIEETALAVNILDERCPKMVKFDVFHRVNTGGVPLNPQEVRNIMAEPSVRLLLQEMSGSEEFQRATKKKVKDIRMGAQELCLRYLTILFYYDWEKRDFSRYFGLLKMMDSAVLKLNTMEEKQKRQIVGRFKKVMTQCQVILEDLSFCKLNNTKINKSLFTSWAVVLTFLNAESHRIEMNAEKIRRKYVEHLKNDSAFYDAITSSTGTKNHIQLALGVICDILEESL